MLEASVYASALSMRAAFGALPERAGRKVAAGVGGLCYRPFGIERSAVESQLSAAFPNRPVTWRRRVAAASYRHFGREFASTVRLSRRGTDQLPERTIDGEQMVATFRRVAGGGASVIVCGHLGNWELSAAFAVTAGMPVSVLAKRQRSSRISRLLDDLRARLGLEVIDIGDASREIPRLLARGRSLGLVADQHAGDAGTVVDFLGRPAALHRGPARIALAFDVPLFFCAYTSEGDRYRARFEPVEVAAAASDTEAAMTRAWARRLEGAIRDTPEQYSWFYRRPAVSIAARPIAGDLPGLAGGDAPTKAAARRAGGRG